MVYYVSVGDGLAPAIPLWLSDPRVLLDFLSNSPVLEGRISEFTTTTVAG